MSIAPEGRSETAFAVSCLPKLTVASPSPPKAATGSPPGRGAARTSLRSRRRSSARRSRARCRRRPRRREASAAPAPSDIRRRPSPLKDGVERSVGPEAARRPRRRGHRPCTRPRRSVQRGRSRRRSRPSRSRTPSRSRRGERRVQRSGRRARGLHRASRPPPPRGGRVERRTRSAPGDLRQLEGLLVERLAPSRPLRSPHRGAPRCRRPSERRRSR